MIMGIREELSQKLLESNTHREDTMISSVYYQDPTLLAAVDKAAQAARISRSVFICRALEQALGVSGTRVPYRTQK